MGVARRSCCTVAPTLHADPSSIGDPRCAQRRGVTFAVVGCCPTAPQSDRAGTLAGTWRASGPEGRTRSGSRPLNFHVPRPVEPLRSARFSCPPLGELDGVLRAVVRHQRRPITALKLDELLRRTSEYGGRRRGGRLTAGGKRCQSRPRRIQQFQAVSSNCQSSRAFQRVSKRTFGPASIQARHLCPSHLAKRDPIAVQLNRLRHSSFSAFTSAP